MKKVLFTLMVGILCISCSKYDDLYNMIYNLDGRVSELETRCSKMNTNIEALQIIVEVLENRDYVVAVAPIKIGSEILGYNLTFAKNGTITIYNQIGSEPEIGIRQDIDGLYYWTLDGGWLYSDDGKKILACGVTPQLKIENNFWYISYNGRDWQKLGLAMGDDGSAFFSNVEYDNDFLFLTLADGTQITLPRTGQGGSSNIKVVMLTINQEDWYYSNIDNNNYFYCEFDMPEITEKAFDEGLIKMYRVYDYDTYDATQIEMPYVRLNEFCAGDVDGDGYDDWGFYTETVDYQFNIGSLMVCYTASDFDYELNEEYIPEAMQFRCVILQ